MPKIVLVVLIIYSFINFFWKGGVHYCNFYIMRHREDMYINIIRGGQKL